MKKKKYLIFRCPYFIGDFKEINAQSISEFKKSNLYIRAINKIINNLLFEVILFLLEDDSDSLKSCGVTSKCEIKLKIKKKKID